MKIERQLKGVRLRLSKVGSTNAAIEQIETSIECVESEVKKAKYDSHDLDGKLHSRNDAVAGLEHLVCEHCETSSHFDLDIGRYRSNISEVEAKKIEVWREAFRQKTKT